MAMTFVTILAALVTGVVKSGDSSMSHAERCFALTQQLHASQFELESVTKLIKDLKSKVSTLVENEDRDELSLSQESAILFKLRAETAQLIEEANRAKHALSDDEKNSTEFKRLVNQSITRLHSFESQLTYTKSELDESMSLREAKESASRKNELRKQMLVNDIDASNHTISDAYRLVIERAKQRSRALENNKAAHEQIKNERRVVENATASFRSITKQIEEVQRNLTSAQEVLYSQIHHRDQLKSQLDNAQARLDSDYIEEASKLHRLSVLRNTTVSQAYKQIEKLNRDIKSVQDEIETVQHGLNLRQPRTIRNRTSGAHFQPQWNTDGIESALRDSRKFLSEEGYSYRFPSFLEDGPQVEPDVSYNGMHVIRLKDESRILSLQYELQDLEAARVDANQTLEMALLNLNQSQVELNDVRKVHLSDLQFLHSLSTSMSSATENALTSDRQVRSLRDLLDILIKRKEISDRKLNKARQALTRADAHFAQTNSALKKLHFAEQDARKSLIGKMEELHALLAERISVLLSVSKGNSELYELDLHIARQRAASINMTEKIRVISDVIEDQRKRHTESVAEVAQVSRRLEDKLRAIVDSEERIRSEDSKIQEQQNSIEASLKERAGMKHALKAAFENHGKLQTMTAKIRLELSSRECNL
jgi:chromosome segregation ATPase